MSPPIILWDRRPWYRPAMAKGLIRAATIKSDKARLATKARPASLPLLLARCRRRRLPRYPMASLVTTATLPRVPTTAATANVAIYGTATAGSRLNKELPPRPTAAAASEPFVPASNCNGNSMVHAVFTAARSVDVHTDCFLKDWSAVERGERLPSRCVTPWIAAVQLKSSSLATNNRHVTLTSMSVQSSFWWRPCHTRAYN